MLETSSFEKGETDSNMIILNIKWMPKVIVILSLFYNPG